MIRQTAYRAREKMDLQRRDETLLKEAFPDENEFVSAKARVESGEPLAYVIGKWFFYDQVYKVSPECLIPQPDTEHLVDNLIRFLPEGGRFADLCTGSGCIAISALAHRKDASGVGVDISEGAIALARENAVLNGVSDRVGFSVADILGANPLGEEKFDVIVSNPPYIRSDVISTLDREVQAEPRIALDGGIDGLVFYRRIIKAYTKNIKPGGYLILEIGYDQADEVTELIPSDFDVKIFKDYGGNDRVVIIRLA